ncbi:MAG: 50S ribosomal protein L22 [Candidatus Methylomirabilales bacterium]|nr:50S ribosomal protein L22 [candidate division NC10 bacterium]MCZ6550119.1 50S ribosomal protein L22 [candidate division NC10 bacterium]
METRAILRFVRVPPQKARLVIDLIRGQDVEQALTIIRFTPKRAARVIEKVLRSAMANAQHNHGLRDVDRLFVKTVFVNQGPPWKRWVPRAMGRATPIRKPTSHITVVLDERPAS